MLAEKDVTLKFYVSMNHPYVSIRSLYVAVIFKGM